MTARAKVAASFLGAAFVAGVIFGQAIADDPEVRYRVIHDTETITETETVTVPGSPHPVCDEMVHHAEAIAKAGSRFDLSSADMLDIISDLRIALAARDGNRATLLENRLRRLEGRTLGASASLSEHLTPLRNTASACLTLNRSE